MEPFLPQMAHRTRRPGATVGCPGNLVSCGMEVVGVLMSMSGESGGEAPAGWDKLSEKPEDRGKCGWLSRRGALGSAPRTP